MSISRICLSSSSIVWAIALLYFYASGRIDNYLTESLRIYSLIGGLLLAVLGVFNLLQKDEVSSCSPEGANDHKHHHDKKCGSSCSHHHHEEDDEHDHGGTELPAPLALLLMVVPLGLSWLYTIDDFSSSVLIRKGLFDDTATQKIINSKPPPTFTIEQFESTTPKTDDGYYKIQLIDLFFASNDPELREIFEKSPIQFVGQVAIEEEPTAKEIRAYRLFVTCCNADARPIAVRVKVDDVSAFQNQQWVSIKGSVIFEIRDGIPIPIIISSSVTDTTKPENSWLN